MQRKGECAGNYWSNDKKGNINSVKDLRGCHNERFTEYYDKNMEVRAVLN